LAIPFLKVYIFNVLAIPFLKVYIFNDLAIPFLKVYIYIMSAGSAASNLGYSTITPNSNINSNFVNKDNSHYPGGFGSNQIPGLPGLAGAKYNVDAAAARVPGICMSGGGKKLKRKIKNITKRYKMTKKSMKRKASGIKRRIKAALSRAVGRTRAIGRSRSRSRGRGIAGGKRTKRRGGNPFMAIRLGKKLYDKQKEPQMGGYSQYQNNIPMTQTYSTGGVLSAADLGLANPVPYQVLPNETNNIDNYNHFTNSGFPSRGH
jgi:hypothetical protein